MFERFSEGARSVVVQAQEQARRFGHGYIGCEHLLLAAASGTEPASAALRECGVTPEAIRQEITRRAGAGEAARLLSDLDREALASIGIDLDMVQAKLEQAFGPGALARDMAGLQRGPRSWRDAVRCALRRRRRGPARPVTDLSGRPAVTGHIPFTATAKKCLAHSLREAVVQNDNYIGVQHVTLALSGMTEGAAPFILTALQVSPVTVRMAVLNRYRKAG